MQYLRLNKVTFRFGRFFYNTRHLIDVRSRSYFTEKKSLYCVQYHQNKIAKFEDGYLYLDQFNKTKFRLVTKEDEIKDDEITILKSRRRKIDFIQCNPIAKYTIWHPKTYIGIRQYDYGTLRENLGNPLQIVSEPVAKKGWSGYFYKCKVGRLNKSKEIYFPDCHDFSYVHEITFNKLSPAAKEMSEYWTLIKDGIIHDTRYYSEGVLKRAVKAMANRSGGFRIKPAQLVKDWTASKYDIEGNLLEEFDVESWYMLDVLSK